jgi:predicted metalloprotease with PDZ domain
MIDYRISLYQASRHRIQVHVTLPTPADETILRIAAWRPGRYEEGNFARLISNLNAYHGSHRIRTEKISKNEWLVHTKGLDSIELSYLYYGAELTAGNTYLDEKLLLINPVNLLVYNDFCKKSEIKLTIDIPHAWSLAGLEHKPNGVAQFSSLDEAFDTPILAGPVIASYSYEISDYTFYIHSVGAHGISSEQLIKDFKQFTEKQVLAFGEFPTSTFSFLLIGVNETYLHGVEHLNNTVIVLGPTAAWKTKRYESLLAVASHELYHVWNVKTIRPLEMLPYRFEGPSYSRLGYVYEGITTFFGDYYLLTSGLITSERYLQLLEAQIQTHVDNVGRFAYSVADSSIDTWVDGYVKGTPGRKVSIYNEGCLMAFILDTKIREATHNKSTLQHLMNSLFYAFGLTQIGYSEKDILIQLQQLSGIDFSILFDQYINAANGYESLLQEAFSFYGIELRQEVPTELHKGSLGIKILTKSEKTFIMDIASGSPADVGGLAEGDQLISINGQEITTNLSEVLSSLTHEVLKLVILRRGENIEKTLPLVQRTFYPTMKLEMKETAEHQIKKNRQHFGI